VKPVVFIILFSLVGLSVKSQVLQLKGTWKFQIGDKPSWSSPSYDDRGWENIYVPSPWEDEGFNGYDGFAWYRKKFDGKLLSKDESYFLNLGFIDDCDEVYLNGVLIGFSGFMPPKFKTAFNNERKYKLLNEHINFQGENTLAVRVFDVTLGGGIIDGDIGIFRSPKSRMLVDLEGMWLFQRTHDKNMPDNEEWEKILVPSPWEHQGSPKYDGNAWYKRSFEVPAHVLKQEEDLVLILGKIDDFDRTYLNGKLIGQTNDNRSFGRSQSFNEQRAYTIPSGLLKAGANVVEVFVQDIGNIGGIYEGPVGIATRTVFQRYYKVEKSLFWDFE
jgi:sialate O-acetylesterase